MHTISLLFGTSVDCDKLDVLQECYAAIDEGVVDKRVVDTAMSYTYTMVIEFLENAKATLLKLFSMALSSLNNFILNDAKRAWKYKDFLKKQRSMRNESYKYEYYEYPDINGDFPIVIPTSEINEVIRRLQDEVSGGDWNVSKVEISVDEILREFGRRALGDGIDPDSLKSSVRDSVYRRVRGIKVSRALTDKTIDSFIENITQYKDQQNRLKRLRTAMIEEYNSLKKSYTKTFEAPPEVSDHVDFMDRYRDPVRYDFVKRERRRYADMNAQMIRMLNGLTTIYQVAYTTSIEVIRERVELNRSILSMFTLNINASSSINSRKA